MRQKTMKAHPPPATQKQRSPRQRGIPPSPLKGEQCNIRMDATGETIKIYINGLLHVSVPQEGLAVQSWKKGEGWYVIEYYLPCGTVITCEYNERGKWSEILLLLDRVL